ncbi:MAG: HD domain-containing protein [Candidatus Omnitrophica bacterium]|nr:HD domain-containing protein [Candidatus Omnitrophota bacterium]
MFKIPENYKILLAPVYASAKKRRVKLYLVGGILRDLVLGRKKENLDFDFAVKKGAISFGRALSKEMRAGFVVLDEERGACRVVKKTKDGFYTLDFTDFRGKTIEEDLKHRDFTINTLVFDPATQELLDLNGAREDLKNKIIRIPAKFVFSEDPLRVMRAFSFSALLGFKIDKDTLRAAKLQKRKLLGVSGERIRDELFKVFASNKAYECLVELDKLKILEILFPEIKKMRGIGQGPYHHLDVWQHTLETLKQLELVLKNNRNKDIKSFLGELISGERKREALLKYAAFLHDVGKPATLRHIDGRTTFHAHERVGLRLADNISRRLKLSNEEIYAVKTIVLWHLRPGYLSDNAILTARAKFRFYRDSGKETISILLLSLADQRATKGPLTTAQGRIRHEKTVARLIRDYYRKQKENKQERLVNGDDIIREFKLSPSPLVGKVLSELEELQAIGKVKTKSEALKAAARFIRNKK